MYRVLVVDDEMPALRFISSIIEQFSNGFHVTGTASSGELALEFLQKNTVDLLLTDISMHGMNGIEPCPSRTSPSSSPVWPSPVSGR